MLKNNPISNSGTSLLQNESKPVHIQTDNNKLKYRHKDEIESEDEYKKLQKSKIRNQDSFINENNTQMVEKPVPKPRKNKLQEQRRGSTSSTGTFNVTSPKVLFKTSSHNLDNIKAYDAQNKRNSSDKIESDSDLSISEAEHEKQITPCQNSEISDISNVEYDHEKKKKTNNKYGKTKLNERTSRPGSSINSKSQQDNIAFSEWKEHQYNYQTITEIIIHKSDRLLLNSFVIHPVVKVHVVDIRNGKYFRKSDKNRSVTFYYENDSNDYILPVISNSYNLQENRSFYPKWEESIIFNEDFEYFVNKNVIIFFEIMDFSTSNIEVLKKNRKEYHKGWYKIAFAFLRIAGKEFPHINKKLRLQLFYMTDTKKLESDYCELWELWDKKTFKKYPSSLYVTIRSMISPTRILESFRSKTPLHKEVLTNIEDRADQSAEIQEQIEQETFEINAKLKDMKRKRNILPEDFVFEIESYDDGCFVLKFSNDGKYLACSTRLGKEFYIIIYSVKDFEEKLRYQCQEGLIYSIVWSDDNQRLLTASSDRSLLIWNVKTNTFQQILQHPSFVYTCDINSENILATGCYDQIIRIWTIISASMKYELSQELKKHKGFVTSVSFTKKHTRTLYSADSQGEIYEWNYNSDRWSVSRLLDIIDLRGIKINQLVLFPDEKRMLVHSRDSALRIISVHSSCVIHWLYGSLNLNMQTFCSISHNGLLVASGSENGLVLIWDGTTGKVLKTLDGFFKVSKAVHCVHFNTKINMLAWSHYGSKESVVIYGSNEVDAKNIENSKNGPEDIHNCLKELENVHYEDILKKMDSLLV
ncbi:jouberin-like isoform X1 [Rhynchophorus ferrugineus]|uniref:Jouberin n=1 Tax=Rhynchophorus ferrugineus TaxID=354439 RepID=A0A834M5Z9_RHYFE|nr:hypothetical protein GWI33_014098 [Rhynchophorus ferrugineus]